MYFVSHYWPLLFCDFYASRVVPALDVQWSHIGDINKDQIFCVVILDNVYFFVFCLRS